VAQHFGAVPTPFSHQKMTSSKQRRTANYEDSSPLYDLMMIVVFILVIIKTAIAKTIVYTFRFLKRLITGRETPCVFCNLYREDRLGTTIVLFRDEVCYIVEDIRPEAEFHYLVIPFRHIPASRNLSGEHYKTVEHMKHVGQRFVKLRHSEMWNEMSSNGLVESRTGFHLPPFNSVEHLHMHILIGKFNSFISELEFTPNTYWYSTCEEFLENSKSL